MEKPKCRLCGSAHWARDGCDFGGKKVAKPTPAEIERNVMTSSAIENSRREGRGVVKPKGTPSERDHREGRPTTATQPIGKRGNAEKPALGKRKTAPKGKKK